MWISKTTSQAYTFWQLIRRGTVTGVFVRSIVEAQCMCFGKPSASEFRLVYYVGSKLQKHRASCQGSSLLNFESCMRVW